MASIADWQKDDRGGRRIRAEFAVGTIALDFDGTLINEHVLTRWVRFLLLKSDLSVGRKCLFLLDSVIRGGVSMIFSSRMSTSVWSVKLAYSTFRGIDKNTIGEMINHRGHSGAFAITLNPTVLNLLEILRSRQKPKPDIEIHSQGAFTDAIRTFLNRKDVENRLKTLGMYPESITIVANNLEMNDAGKCTGKLIGAVCTKFDRIRKCRENTLFIGDDKDEAALRTMGVGKVRFLNWKHCRC